MSGPSEAKVGMGHRKMRGAEEYDAFTRWRRWYCYLARPGVVAKVKRGANKRERATERRALVDVKKYGDE